MKYKKLIIEYGHDSMPIEYNLFDYDVVQRWAARILAAQSFPYSIDNPDRFYGFDTLEKQIDSALQNINSVAQDLKNLGIPIERSLKCVNDQDTLNYLHHIFEIYHGLLNDKEHDKVMQQKLCDLNIAVHRCESIQRGSKPRHVVTYFGLPKNQILSLDDYSYFTNCYDYGTVYLNYAEIGKTLEDLALDNDRYIDRSAFQPFKHFSADFNVKFFVSQKNDVDQIDQLMSQYYDKNKDFFASIGLDKNSPYLKPGNIPLAQIVTSVTLEQIASRQHVKSVKLYS